MNQTKMKQVKEFKLNERVYGNFLVKQVKSGKTVANKPYMDIILSDKTGEILAKLWDSTETQEGLIKPSTFVYATGMTTEWDGKPQLKVEYIEVIDSSKMKIEDYIKTAPISSDVMLANVFNYINDIQDEEIRLLVESIADRYQDEFKVHPAAKGMHHAIYGGLAYHTLTMLRCAEKLSIVYPFLNRDLLYAGIVLHDIEKIHEMIALNGTTEDYSTKGKLLGHIVQGILLVERVGHELSIPEPKIEVLQHLIASHHGKGEWGSPQPPKLAEAIMIHFIDNIDAKMYMAKEALDNAKEEDIFTGKIRGLDNNQLYIYKY